MNCKNCGSKINEESKFCRKCGEPVNSYGLTGVNNIKKASKRIAIFAAIIAVVSLIVSIVAEVNSPRNVVGKYISNFSTWDSYKVYSLTSKKLREYEIEKYFDGSMVEYRDAIDNLPTSNEPLKGSLGWKYVSTNDLSRSEIEELEAYYENKINITKAKKVIYEICGSSVAQEHLSEIIVIKEGLSWKVLKELHSIIGVEGTAKSVYSLDYMGTWYGFGTDGNDAQFEITIRPNDKDSAYVKIKGWGTNYRLEESETKIVFWSSAKAKEVSDEQQIKSFSFCINENGKEEMKIMFIDSKSEEQLAESIYAGRTPKRDEALGEIYEEAEVILPSYPSKKDDFQRRYDELSNKAALSGSQQEMNRESLVLYEEWDILLNEIYNYLQSAKSASEFKVIEKDEVAWIKQKEAAIQAVKNEYAGGSVAPLMANATAIDYTKQRCSYLISLID